MRVLLTTCFFISVLTIYGQDFRNDVATVRSQVDSADKMIISDLGFNRFFAKKSATLIGTESSEGLKSTYFKADLADEKFTLGFNRPFTGEDEATYSVLNIGLSFDGNEELGLLFDDGAWNEKFSISFGWNCFSSKTINFGQRRSNHRAVNGALMHPARQQEYMAAHRAAAYEILENELSDEETVIRGLPINASERDALIESVNEEKTEEWYEKEIEAFKQGKAYNSYSLKWLRFEGAVQTQSKKFNLLNDSLESSTGKYLPWNFGISGNYYREAATSTWFGSIGLGLKSQNLIDLIEIQPAVQGSFIFYGLKLDSLVKGDTLNLIDLEEASKKVYFLNELKSRVSPVISINGIYYLKAKDWKNRIGLLGGFSFFSDSYYRRTDINFGIPIVLSGKDEEAVNIQLKCFYLDAFNESEALDDLEEVELFNRKKDSWQFGVSVGIPIGKGLFK